MYREAGGRGREGGLEGGIWGGGGWEGGRTEGERIPFYPGPLVVLQSFQ